MKNKKILIWDILSLAIYATALFTGNKIIITIMFIDYILFNLIFRVIPFIEKKKAIEIRINYKDVLEKIIISLILMNTIATFVILLRFTGVMLR